MILALQTPEAANLLIKKWMFIKGKQVKISRLIAEPGRCIKCQKVDVGHIVASHISKHNICRICSDKHKTMEYNKKERKLMKCTNCNKMGHPAWDHMCMCPFFVQKTDTYNKKHSKNAYKYYHMAKPHTWELIDSDNNMENFSSSAAMEPPQAQISTRLIQPVVCS